MVYQLPYLYLIYQCHFQTMQETAMIQENLSPFALEVQTECKGLHVTSATGTC